MQTDEDLPDNCVRGLTHNGEGYLWEGTRGGRLHFKDSAFTKIPLAVLQEVGTRVVHVLFRDSRDRLWLGLERRGILSCLVRGDTRV